MNKPLPRGVLDWNVASDYTNIRKGAVALQSALHERIYAPIFRDKASAQAWVNTDRTAWRKRVIEKFELFLGGSLFGRVLEIGAGVGWCSALLSRRADVEQVIALDYDPYCVSILMPKVHELLEANCNKIRRALGSFNTIPLKEYFDFVVAIGALHHSEDLSETLRECYGALKPGGFLVASEPLEYDSRSQAYIREKEDRIDAKSGKKYGKETKHKDNSDHYVRLSEWISSAYAAGFDVLPVVFDDIRGRRCGDAFWKKPNVYYGHSLRTFKPYFSENGSYDSLMLILHKPDKTSHSHPFSGINAVPTLGDRLNWSSFRRGVLSGRAIAIATARRSLDRIPKVKAFLKKLLER